jgi:malate dehydrogenase (oxaloacetate-decarboxylating)(NADP+)
MPAIHSAAISTKLLRVLGNSTLIGPLLVGLKRSVQIVPIGANVSDLVNMAALAAYNLDR